MEALVVTFKNHASQEQFTAATAGHVPVFAELDGLLAKIWIADPESGTKGAVYLFSERTALDAYLESDLFAGILAEPSFEDTSWRSYHVVDELTARTQPGIQIVGGVTA
jgi:Putative mono-oxygenase ydhR